jgi:hypothetical protein
MALGRRTLEPVLTVPRHFVPQELTTTREWEAAAYPSWLVFEVEQQLQIRPLQYKVAVQLMQEQGAIAQLNMGGGKTRVILPMLLLYLANGRQLVRTECLSAYTQCTYAMLHKQATYDLYGQ